ncbi:SprT-like domain-containing protein [Agromyces aerolatus]|uniref:SprT-like domain-containing protein n=1 Tax=Agromyces sp. LY-1074 TaxID=3074080 RepID=UPI00285563CB|nr:MULTISPECIES: SprT-like domain-containing protein [unclassified Agromyces]MDR5698440.1 SprT-like domain-containing protein [Agromyces sp. LY-1074]MDR5704734.1 SprT-like domain-containing protein [Agromyces sp. LY-1358]
MADLDRVRRWADALIALHLDPSVWRFEFDHAKRRAGLCDYTAKRISVSRYLAARYDDDEIHQILLHEVAHAMAGPRAGHGPKWRATAASLGYVGRRTHDGEVADELAPWVGRCPAGHEHFRYREPVRPLSCGLCRRGFDTAHLIEWRRREITAAMRRRAASSSAFAR